MYFEELKDMVYMSNTTGKRTDYVQAGGGNTSAKFKDGYMAIKASGYFLKEMTDSLGFVVVNGAEMKQYHESSHDSECDCNKEAMELALKSIIQINGEKDARPSVEVGFHSVLGKYVLHLHPVYVNILMCSKGGVEKAISIVQAAGMSCIALPYSMPGYNLTKLIIEALNDYSKTHTIIPQVVFLKNHGVVTHADTAREAIDIMDNINNSIIAELELPVFPTPVIEKDGDRYKSANTWMKKVLSEGDIATKLRSSPVYPDQLVYTANELSLNSGNSKIVIVGGEILYNTNEKEAIALEETMAALVYIYNCIQDKGMQLELLSQADCADILGWDSEAYRKNLMSAQ